MSTTSLIFFNNQKVNSNFSTEINNKILKIITLYDINIISTVLNVENFNEYIKHFQTENKNDID